MRYIKKYENMDMIEIVGHPHGNIIKVTRDELDELGLEFDILWDDDPLDPKFIPMWKFFNSDEDEIRNWLQIYRSTGDVDSTDNIRKYNL
jgi:hypothetical protein